MLTSNDAGRHWWLRVVTVPNVSVISCIVLRSKRRPELTANDRQVVINLSPASRVEFLGCPSVPQKIHNQDPSLHVHPHLSHVIPIADHGALIESKAPVSCELLKPGLRWITPCSAMLERSQNNVVQKTLNRRGHKHIMLRPGVVWIREVFRSSAAASGRSDGEICTHETAW